MRLWLQSSGSYKKIIAPTDRSLSRSAASIVHFGTFQSVLNGIGPTICEKYDYLHGIWRWGGNACDFGLGIRQSALRKSSSAEAIPFTEFVIGVWKVVEIATS